MGVSSNTANPVKNHRRDVWLKIVGPVALAGIGLIVFGVVLIVAVASGEMVNKQVTTIMGILATVFIILPLAILCLLPYAVLALSAVGAGKLYAHAKTPLRFSRRITEQVAEQTERHVPRLARPLIAINVRLSRWEGVLEQVLPSGKEAKE